MRSTALPRLWRLRRAMYVPTVPPRPVRSAQRTRARVALISPRLTAWIMTPGASATVDYNMQPYTNLDPAKGASYIIHAQVLYATGPNFVNNAILGPLMAKRVATLDRIAIDHNLQRTQHPELDLRHAGEKLRRHLRGHPADHGFEVGEAHSGTATSPRSHLLPDELRHPVHRDPRLPEERIAQRPAPSVRVVRNVCQRSDRRACSSTPRTRPRSRC